jgi:hypothetical protein
VEAAKYGMAMSDWQWWHQKGTQLWCQHWQRLEKVDQSDS